MYFQIEDTRLEQNEVECLGFIRRRNPSARGGDFSETRTLQILIDQTLTGVAANSARWRGLDRYVNISKCGFLDDTGEQTPIWLDGGQSLSGIRMVNPLSWTPRSPVEFATMLSMMMTFEAEYPVNGSDQILEYEDSLYFEDEGDKRIVGVETDTGPVEFFETCQQPKRYLTQSGYCVARDAYPIHNSPLLANVPMIQRGLGRVTPVKRGRAHIGYRCDWRYVFVVGSYGNWFPQLR